MAAKNSKFNIVIAGAPMAGKRTLANALLGRKVLPANQFSLPVTEVVYGTVAGAKLTFDNPLRGNIDNKHVAPIIYQHLKKNGFKNVPPLRVDRTDFLKPSVSYTGEIPPAGNSCVKRLTVCDPSEFLKEYTVTVLPSIGLSYDDGLIRKSLSNADLVIFVINAVTAFSSLEHDYIEDYLSDAPAPIFFAVNQMDRLGRDTRDFKSYIKKKLEPYTDDDERCVCFISAQKGMTGRDTNNASLVRDSGIDRLLKQISEFLQNSIEDAVQDARRKTETIDGSIANSKTFRHTKTADQLTNIDDYITFAEELIERYTWKEDIRQSLTQRLDRIKQKQKDLFLNLSVIGEFNTGKSTFINALMREDLLRSSYIELGSVGTTVAATILEYSPERFLKVRNKSGKAQTFFYNTINAQKDALKQYAANPAYAKNVDSLTAGIPSSSLKNNLRIIDTPGTGNTELWHSETTIHTIDELSDASIILIDPTKPLPKSQIDFIHDYLQGVLYQCIFVITKIDELRPAECSRTVEYVRQKLSYEFDLDDPVVITYASLDVLETAIAGGVHPNPRKTELVEKSFKSETALYQYIERKKASAQANKLMILLEEMYVKIGSNMDEISSNYQKEHDQIVKSQKTDLRSFTDRQIRICTREFEDAVQNIRTGIESAVSNACSDAKASIFRSLDECKTEAGISNYTQNTFKTLCEQHGTGVLKNSSQMFSRFDGEAEKQITLFKNAFEKEYRRLGLVPMTHIPVSKGITVNVANTVDVSIQSAITYVQDAVKSTNRRMGGGAAAGAAIGTAILPGVGTIIGGIIGLFGGAMASKSDDEIRRQAKAELTNPLNTYFEKIEYQNSNNIDKYIRQLKQNITNEIDRHYGHYCDFVKQMIKEDERKKISIERKIKDIKDDMVQITQIGKKLNMSREKLR